MIINADICLNGADLVGLCFGDQGQARGGFGVIREVHLCDGEESALQPSGSGIWASMRTRARN